MGLYIETKHFPFQQKKSTTFSVSNWYVAWLQFTGSIFFLTKNNSLIIKRKKRGEGKVGEGRGEEGEDTLYTHSRSTLFFFKNFTNVMSFIANPLFFFSITRYVRPTLSITGRTTLDSKLHSQNGNTFVFFLSLLHFKPTNTHTSKHTITQTHKMFDRNVRVSDHVFHSRANFFFYLTANISQPQSS